MNNRKIRKKAKLDFIEKFKPIIDLHKNELPVFDINKKYELKKYNTNSWFNIDKFTGESKTKPKIISTDKLVNCELKCIKVKMILSDVHKQILDNWFKAYTLIYNKTLDYIRSTFPFTKKEINKTILTDESKDSCNFHNKRYIRNQMNLAKKQIQKKFVLVIDKNQTKTKTKNIKCKIDIHTLDKAIFQLVENINSCKTNMEHNNIKRFRLKYWKFNRPSQTMELEKIKFQDGILCKSIFENLEDIKYIYNNQDYKITKIEHDFKINHNLILDEYYLYIPISTTKTNVENRKKIIVLDPGLRTMMTGLCEDETINIGSNVNSIIKKDITRLNKIKNNELIPNKIKKKTEKRINKKISDKVDDLHWKVINYLTSNFKTIFLGDMSAKSIVAKHNKTLSNEMKVACLRTKYFEFRMRLKYKCNVTNTKFKLVNEYYTSKTCSLCGNYNDNLKGEKVYNCLKCKNNIDRDINGCRNIYMKQYI